MIVRAEDVRAEGLQVDLQPKIGPLSYEGGLEIGVAATRLVASIARARRGLSCAGRLVATARVPCARCLEQYPLTVDKEFDLLYLPPRAGAKEGPVDVQIAREDLDVSYLDEEGKLDMDQLAAEQIYLDIPLKPLCSLDCRGLCSRCGANLNTEGCRCASTS